MPQSLSMKKLNLTCQDSNERENAAAKEQEVREKAERSVTFGDDIFDPIAIDYDALDSQIKKTLTRDLFKITLGKLADMEEFQEKSIKSKRRPQLARTFQKRL
jgi:hypothetical protein